MRRSTLIAGVALVSTMLPLAVRAQPPAQPLRWVLVDDLRVRLGSGSDQKVVGTLSRGAELVLKQTGTDGYCLVEGEGQFGYVACKHLSAERVKRPRAGEDGVDKAQRWAAGNAVTVREAPQREAPVVGRLALNTIVKLTREEAGSGYCQIKLASGASGYTACRYLSPTPVVLAHVRGLRHENEAPSPDYDPERAFWLEPGWNALENYVEYLKQRNKIPPQGPWPRDEALERMKAHLALGLKGRKPEPFADWQQLKRKAAQDLDLTGEAQKLQAQGKKPSKELWRLDGQAQQVAGELQTAIRIWGPLHDAISADGGGARVIQLVRALNFPNVRPSLFRSEAELAPPGTSTEDASGRFGIVFRQMITPRPKPKAGSEAYSGAGLYDMLGRTQALVRPVQRVQLFRDGRLRIEKSFVRSSETLWRDVDEPECSGWIPGFNFGDADATLWRNFTTGGSKADDERIRQESVKRNPADTLYAFYTINDLPAGTARPSEEQMKLNREETGFVRGVYLNYDLDGDGIVDISVWEGQGKGPGHLEGPTTTDDKWYRLVLVNINGKWKVLGSDFFGYGCGC